MDLPVLPMQVAGDVCKRAEQRVNYHVMADPSEYSFLP